MLRSLLNRWLRKDVRSRRRKSSHAEALEDRTLLATLVVNQPLDVASADGLLSLREAVTAVNTGALLCHNVPGHPQCSDHNSPVNIPLGPGPHFIQLPPVSSMILVVGPLTVTSSSDITIQGHGAALSGINSPTSAIFNLQGGNVTLADMTLSGFIIGDGGAVTTTGERLEVNGVQFLGNFATGDGGAIYSHGAELEIANSTFVDNSAGKGGAIYADGGTVRIDDSTFSGNSATYGGAFYAHGVPGMRVDSAVFQGNESLLDGGAMFLAAFAEIGVSDAVELSGNSAGRDGGAIYVASGETTLGITDASDNEALQHGGAIYVTAADLDVQSSTSITNNKASVSGGGLYAFDADVTLSGDVTLNKAFHSGGGIFADGGTLTTGLQSSVNDNDADVDGGGLSLINVSATIRGSIEDNTAVEDGGGIHIEDGDVTIEDAEINRNTADRDGGATFVSGQATVQILDTDIEFNTALQNGGGVAVFDAELTLGTEAHVRSNTAQFGGGVHNHFSGPFTMAPDASVDQNTALTDGGGLHMLYNTRARIGGTFSGNIAHQNGGGIWLFGGVTRIDEAEVRDNDAVTGGGLYATTTVPDSPEDPRGLTMTESEFSGNSVGAATVDLIGGGGIHLINRGETLLDHVTVPGNRGGLGGGLLIENIDGAVRIDRSTFASNQANDGGGIALVATPDATNLFSQVTVSGNAVNDSGGGIFIASGDAVIRHSTVTQNTAELDSIGGGRGGGLEIPLTSAVQVDHSVIGGNIDNTGVAPDIHGAVAAQFTFVGDAQGGTVSTGNGNIVGIGASAIDAKLWPLADNGGQVPTHLPRLSSPVVNAGDSAFLAPDLSLVFDQRGVPFDRVVAGRIDMGAAELQPFSFSLTVDLADDEDDDDFSPGDLSLREAIRIANFNPGPDIIGVHTGLAGASVNIELGEMAITEDLTIKGPSGSPLTVDGKVLTRIFRIDDGDTDTTISVELSGLKLTKGSSPTTGADGGAILSYEALVLDNIEITDSQAGRGGAVAALGGTLTITDSTIDTNLAVGEGGGIYTTVVTNVQRSAISNNHAFGSGGGVSADNDLVVTNSTFSGNIADQTGGAIVADQKPAVVSHSTIALNSAAVEAGGIFADAPVTIDHSIVAANNQSGSPSDLVQASAFSFDATYSLIGSGTDASINNLAGNQIGTTAIPIDPRLRPLEDNGGPTRSHAFDTSSPALDFGNAGILSPPDTDQRGFSRVAGSAVDIGAFESQGNLLFVDTWADIVDGDIQSIGQLLNDPGQDGRISLREAILVTNSTPGADVIRFDSSLDKVSVDLTIKGDDEDQAFTGDLDITDDVELIGNGATLTLIDGRLLGDRVFHLLPGVSVDITGLTISGGQVDNTQYGGGLLVSSARLDVSDTAIRDNEAGYGGGVAVNATSGDASLSLVDTVIESNIAQFSGGGVLVFSAVDGAHIASSMERSTIRNNQAGSGAGIANLAAFGGIATFSVLDSTVSHNMATDATVGGGGVTNFAAAGIDVTTDGVIPSTATLSISNSTISGNESAADGAGLLNDAVDASDDAILELRNVTIADNHTAGKGGGTFNGGLAQISEMHNTIIAENTATTFADDLANAGLLSSATFNLIADPAGHSLGDEVDGNVIGHLAQLGPLGDNGGSTFTHSLQILSPAFNGGTGDQAFNPDGDRLTTDQRGFSRVLGNEIDIGAVEVHVVDYGDAPDAGAGTGSANYETLAVDNGPSHDITAQLFLGTNLDGEDGTLHSATADADDIDSSGIDDEDGVANPFAQLNLRAGEVPTVSMIVTNTTGDAATIAGWIDYNGDGVFDNATERATAVIGSGTVGGSVTLTFPKVPTAIVAQTFARFRVSTDSEFISDPQPTGHVTDGEVEDYAAVQARRVWDGEAGDNLWLNPVNWALQRADGVLFNSNALPDQFDDVYVSDAFSGETIVLGTTEGKTTIRSIDSAAALRIIQQGVLEIKEDSRIAELTLDSTGNTLSPTLETRVSGGRTLVIDNDLNWNESNIFNIAVWVNGSLRAETTRHKSLQSASIRFFGDDSLWSTGHLQLIGGTLINHGTMNWTSNSDVTSTQATFVNVAGATLIHDAPAVPGNPRIFAGSFINHGTFDVRNGNLQLGANGAQAVTHGGQFSFDANTSVTWKSNHTFTKDSEIVAEKNSTLTFETSPAIVEGGFDVNATVVIRNGGDLRFKNSVTIPRLFMEESFFNQISGPGTITVVDEFRWLAGNIAAGTLISQDTTVIGDLITNAGLGVTNGGVFVNQGDATWQAGGITFNSGAIRNEGTMLVTTDATMGAAAGGNVLNLGTWTLAQSPGSGTNAARGIPFRNLGDFTLIDSTVDYERFDQDAGTLTLDDSTISMHGGPLKLNGGILAGSGQITGSLDQTGGELRPGLPIGTLDITGSYKQIAGSLSVEIGGVNAKSEHDQLIVGDADFKGALEVLLVNNYAPVGGESFLLVDGTTIGAFQPLNLAATPVNVEWGLAYSPVVLNAIDTTPMNRAPSVRQPLADVSVNEDSGLTTIDVRNVFEDLDGDLLTLSVSSNSDPAVLAAVLDRGDLNLTTQSDQHGAVTITVQATDPDGLFAEDTFAVTVNSVNDAPGFVKGDDLLVAENAGLVTINKWATHLTTGPSNENSQAMLFEIVGNSNPTLFSVLPAVDSTGGLTFRSATDASGKAIIELRVVDDGGRLNGGDNTSEAQAFVIHVIPEVITVTTVVDEDDGVLGEGTGVSLREAILASNAAAGPNTIQFALPTGSVIDLETELPTILDELSILGPGKDLLTVGHIDGNVLSADSLSPTTAPLLISDLTISGATVAGINSRNPLTIERVAVVDNVGMGIQSLSSLLLSDSIVARNFEGGINSVGSLGVVRTSVSDNGNLQSTYGGIRAIGPTVIEDSTIHRNSGFNGGGLSHGFQPQLDELWIRGSTISKNTSSTNGGGLSAHGPTLVTNTAIHGNIASGGGGGVYVSDNVIFTNTTISGNTADHNGGGVANYGGSILMSNSTITNNRADANGDTLGSGGGVNIIWRDYLYSTGQVELHNTIVAGNFAGLGNQSSELTEDTGQDIGFFVSSSSHNLIGSSPSDPDSGGISTDPNLGNHFIPEGTALRLGQLADNGGPTLTHAVLGGSPAFDAGSNTVADAAVLLFDQRGPGFTRILGGSVDIGAFEAQPPEVTIPLPDVEVNEDAQPALIELDGHFVQSTGATSGFTYLVASNSAPDIVLISEFRSELTLTFPRDAFGESHIVIRATDSDGHFVEDEFVVTVNPINDSPSFTKGDDVFVAETLGHVTVPAWATNITAGPLNESGQSLSFEVVNNSNSALFSSAPSVDDTGRLVFQPSTDASGSAIIELQLVDNGGRLRGGSNVSSIQTFTVTVVPDVIVVNTVLDENDRALGLGAGTSLREAISVSNVFPGPGTIEFDLPPGAVIDLTTLQSLVIEDDVTINGPAADRLEVGIFAQTVGNATTLVVGTLETQPTVSISNLVFSGSGSDSGTRGIMSRGQLSLNRITVRDHAGAGLVNTEGAVANIVASTISGNRASGIFNAGTLQILNSTISGNSAEYGGGGISNSLTGSVALTNVTVVDNRGYISQDSLLSPFRAGGIVTSNELFTLHNTIVARNTVGTDNSSGEIQGRVFGANNIIETERGAPDSGDLPGHHPTNPRNLFVNVREYLRLGPLQDNGGPTLTHALIGGSPAIDAGDNNVALQAGLSFDQRGIDRFQTGSVEIGVVDIGAYEANSTSHELVVTTVEDESDGALGMGSGDSLREVLEFASHTVGADAITFSLPAGSVIEVSDDLPHSFDDIKISGPGVNQLTVNGGNFSFGTPYRPVEAEVTDLTVSSSGYSSFSSARGALSVLGIGTITNATAFPNRTLTLKRVDVVGSGSYAVSGHNVEIHDSLLSDSKLGGVYLTGQSKIVSSTITKNGRSGVFNSGGLWIHDSTISENHGHSGAGIHNQGTLWIWNSTITSNFAAASGGGISNDGQVTLTNVTLVNNQADSDGNGDGDGGGLYSPDTTQRTALLHNTIVADNYLGLTGTPGSEIAGEVASDSSHNLIGGLVTDGDVGGLSSDPQLANRFVAASSDLHLGPLLDNGGPTLTHALLGGSPAVDGADLQIVVNANLAFDQRGEEGDYHRAIGTHPDIGAYEARVPVLLTPFSDLTINEDHSAVTIDVAGRFADLDNHGLSFSVFSNTNLGLVNATLQGSELSISGQPDQFSSTSSDIATLTIRATNSQGFYVDGCLDVFVVPVNDAPSFTTESELNILGDGYGYSFVDWATDISVGPGNESSQQFGFDVVSVSHPALFDVLPAIDADGTLTFTPKAVETRTTAAVSVVLTDDGGTELGGADTSLAVSFGIHILPPIVTTLLDENDGVLGLGSGESLREILAVTNDRPGQSTITFAPELAGTMSLEHGRVRITDATNLSGPGAEVVSISAGGLSRVFEIGVAVSAEISGLHIRDGFAESVGGGIINSGSLVLRNVAVTNNAAPMSAGGGIYSSRNLSVINSTVANNIADLGGGIFSFAPSNNGVEELLIVGSTISHNNAASGAGIITYTTTTVSNSTISTNTTRLPENPKYSSAGGLLIASTPTFLPAVKIENSTIANNVLLGAGQTPISQAGGIMSFGAFLEINNTLVLSNSVDSGATNADLFSASTVIAATATLISGPVGAAELTMVSPEDVRLGPLTDNGGPTLTHALMPGSIAIDAGDPSAIPTDHFDLDTDRDVDELIPFDQRGSGFDRFLGHAPDVGAFEYRDTVAPTAVLSAPESLRVQEVLVLDGSASFDDRPDGIVTYRWSRTNGLINGQPSIETSVPQLSVATSEFPLGIETFELIVVDSVGNGSAPAFVDVTFLQAQADLSFDRPPTVEEETPDGFLMVGEELFVQIWARNDGPQDASNPRLQVVLPAGLELIDVEVAGVQYPILSHEAGILTLDLGSRLQWSVDTGVATGVILFLTATQAGSYTLDLSLSADDPDPDPANNSESLSFDVLPPIPDVILVTTVADEDDGRLGIGEDSLREAIHAANSEPGLNTIQFDLPAGSVIDLESVLPRLMQDVTIAGPGAEQLAVGLHAGTIFSIDAVSNVEISGVTIRDGQRGIDNSGNLSLVDVVIAGNMTPAIGGRARGAGIFNDGELAIVGSTIRGNSAGNRGGGLYNRSGSVQIVDSVIEDNSATVSGGGLYQFADEAEILIVNSVIRNNSADERGGGVLSVGHVRIVNSTLSGNEALRGGGIWSSGDDAWIVVLGSTISNNSADDGGGIHNGSSGGTFHVLNSTISGNTAERNGGGAFLSGSGDSRFVNVTVTANRARAGSSSNSSRGGGISSAGSSVELYNSIVAGNFLGIGSFGDQIRGAVAASSSYNLIGTTATSDDSGGLTTAQHNLFIDDASELYLGPLTDNGGPTQTHALLAGSLAIDNGGTGLAVDDNGNPLTTDQRGEGRIFGTSIDIGAFELVDQDGDGVDNSIEDRAPNSGDGNNDGTPDRQQSNVASFPNAVDAEFLTIVAPAATNLLNVAPLSQPTDGIVPADSAMFPFGLFTFTVSGIGVGTTAVVDIIPETMAPLNTYQKFGQEPGSPQTHQYSFLFDGTTGAELLTDRIRLHFVDGQRGDNDLTANGFIVDPGGPAYNPATVVAPLTAPDVVVTQQPAPVTTSFADLGTQPHAATIDWGDGSHTDATIEEAMGGGTIAGEHAYATPGDYLVRIDVTDDAGNVTSVQKLISVHSIRLIDDPLNPGQQIIVVGGTQGRDRIEFSTRRAGRKLVVRANGRTVDTYATQQISRIVAYGGQGNDQIRVKHSVSIDAELYGGSGHDHLESAAGNDQIFGGPGHDWIFAGNGNDAIFADSGNDVVFAGDGDDIIFAGSENDIVFAGSGNDIVIGGDGRDTIFGGFGHDMIIGGAGQDDLFGQHGGDLLIGGTTSYDNNAAALILLMTEWTANTTYVQRIENIRHGQGSILAGSGVHLAASDTVNDDQEKDLLFGGSGRDWYFARTGGSHSTRDRLFGERFNETIDELLHLV